MIISQQKPQEVIQNQVAYKHKIDEENAEFLTPANSPKMLRRRNAMPSTQEDVEVH